jgi:hypothetical protein
MNITRLLLILSKYCCTMVGDVWAKKSFCSFAASPIRARCCSLLLVFGKLSKSNHSHTSKPLACKSNASHTYAKPRGWGYFHSSAPCGYSLRGAIPITYATYHENKAQMMVTNRSRHRSQRVGVPTKSATRPLLFVSSISSRRPPPATVRHSPGSFIIGRGNSGDFHDSDPFG